MGKTQDDLASQAEQGVTKSTAKEGIKGTPDLKKGKL